VLAITEGLHDVHSLEKEAAAVHTAVALLYLEPLIHFALVSGNRFGPALHCFSPSNIDKELMEAAHNFLRNGGVSVDPEAKVASVLAITEGLHDVHSLGKEAVAVHTVAKATTMELMERVGALSRQTKKYQTEAGGLRAENRKDKEIVLALRKERDLLFKEIERLAIELKDAHNSNDELVMEKILLEEENGKIIVNMEANRGKLRGESVGATCKTAHVEAGSTVAIFGIEAIGLAVGEGARLCGAAR
ncbi:hypothetical protein IFM89_002091, partial [Coptis chinensis]